MKYLKRVVLVLLFLVVATLSINAQNRVVASADVRISVVKALQINKLQGDLSFGDFVQTGVSAKMERTPDKGILFEVNGNPGRDVTLDFENVSLGNGSENNSLNFIPHLSQTKSNSTYINPTEVHKGSSHKLENINGTGYLYLWVGGEIMVDKELSNGDYSGDFSVTVSY